MFNGWISLRVKDPKRVAEWYTENRILELVGAREDIGTKALGSRDHGLALILIPGDQFDRPELMQLPFHVVDVDAEYERLKSEGVKFEEPPKNMPWVGDMPTLTIQPVIRSKYAPRSRMRISSSNAARRMPPANMF
ncbi:MAG TPA: VOC family protein [Chthoniobacterales bacterium]|nr:VOC family protein [Chthoniobacterales bacterium]